MFALLGGLDGRNFINVMPVVYLQEELDGRVADACPAV